MFSLIYDNSAFCAADNHTHSTKHDHGAIVSTKDTKQLTSNKKEKLMLKESQKGINYFIRWAKNQEI